MTYKNGDYYVGEWKDNKKHGLGKLFKNNKIYEGRWNKDELVQKVE
jgi:hypothetical protein